MNNNWLTTTDQYNPFPVEVIFFHQSHVRTIKTLPNIHGAWSVYVVVARWPNASLSNKTTVIATSFL